MLTVGCCSLPLWGFSPATPVLWSSSQHFLPGSSTPRYLFSATAPQLAVTTLGIRICCQPTAHLFGLNPSGWHPSIWGFFQLGHHCLSNLHWSINSSQATYLLGQDCPPWSSSSTLLSAQAQFRRLWTSVPLSSDLLHFPPPSPRVSLLEFFIFWPALLALYWPSVTFSPLEITWPSHLPTQLLLSASMQIHR